MHQLSCHCGTVRGAVLPGWPSARVRCHCTDCRAFANFLDPKSKVLAAQGGTELVQVSQSRLRIDQSMDHVQTARLTDKGLLRWYAGCCRTPIGNTLPTATNALLEALKTELVRAQASPGLVELRFTPGELFVLGRGVVQGGAVAAIGEVERAGRTLVFTRAQLLDAQRRVVATGTSTLPVIDAG